MQRIARVKQRPALRSSFSVGIRYNSTEVPPKPNGTAKRVVRVPLLRLGDIVIPSAEEIRAKAAATLKVSYTADISYLDNAPEKSLAAKLARIGRGETIEKEIPEENLPAKVSRSPPKPEDIAALTAKRREERAARQMRTHVPASEKSKVLRSESDILTAKRLEERVARHERTYVPVSENSELTRSESDIAALTAKRREERAAREMRTHVPVSENSELTRSEFAKTDRFRSPESNWQARRPSSMLGAGRERGQASGRWNEQPRMQRERPQWSRATQRRRAPVARATKSSTPSMLNEDFDDPVFESGGHLPEFSGPEHLSSNLLDRFGPSFSPNDVIVVAQSGTAFKIPISKVDSFYKSDYSRYVSASKEDYASPPDVLGAVKVAACTLSLQSHYNLTARDRTLELVAQASQPSKPVVKSPSHR